jgi:hypothetical protein
MNDKHRAGDDMAGKSRQQILGEIEQIKTETPCSPMDAAVIYLVELIQNDRRAKIAEAWILSRHSGDGQAHEELQTALENMGILKSKGKK